MDAEKTREELEKELGEMKLKFLELKECRVEFQNIRKRYEHILQSAPDAMIFVNKEAKIVRINAQFGNLFGYMEEELIGRDLHLLIPERYHIGHRYNVASYFEQPAARPMGTNPPFIANNQQNPATGYFGSGMLSLWGSAEKLGPYSDAQARHQFLQSKFHRSVDYCGSCHDVSNPAVGDLANNNGAQIPLPPGTYSGLLGSPVGGKAAFNNFPYQYGIIERTYSEFYSGMLSKTLVSNYSGLPADLKAGAIKAAFDSAKGNYADGTPRYFSCQTCHLRAVSGQGCNKAGVPIRSDLPLHDMTGGNYWMPDAILYQNRQGTLRLGGGLPLFRLMPLLRGRTGQSSS